MVLRYCSQSTVTLQPDIYITGPARPAPKQKRIPMFELEEKKIPMFGLEEPGKESSVTTDTKTAMPSRQVKPLRRPPRRLPPLPAISDILRLYRVKAKKQMSQNFLLNPRVCSRLISHAKIQEGGYVVEIGPGPGNLTRFILERNPREMFVIEKDRRFLPMLEQLADAAIPGQLKIVVGDVMDYTLETLFPGEARRDWNQVNDQITFVGNLPFAVSIPLLIRWLKQMSTKSGPFSYGRIPLTLTFQKEVGLRLKADVLSHFRSRIGIMTQTFARVDYEFNIKGASFYPEPAVDVAVVRITPLEENLLPEGMDFNMYEKFVRTLFHHRRSSLEMNVKHLFPKHQADQFANQLLEESRFDPSYFPLMISTEEIANMAGIWFKICQQNPGLIHYDYRARKKPPKILKEMFKD